MQKSTFLFFENCKLNRVDFTVQCCCHCKPRCALSHLKINQYFANYSLASNNCVASLYCIYLGLQKVKVS